MKITKHRERVEIVEYARRFVFRNDPNYGFSFDCDEHGNLDVPKLVRENYEKCVRGEHDVIDEGIVKFVRHYNDPARGLCKCGREVVLDGFTNTCDGCGRDYNLSGQELAPSECWGEETGEHWADIARL